MPTKHIVKSYDEDLDMLKSKLSEMGREAEDQISKAGRALLNRDSGLADVIIVCDHIVIEPACLEKVKYTVGSGVRQVKSDFLHDFYNEGIDGFRFQTGTFDMDSIAGHIL